MLYLSPPYFTYEGVVVGRDYSDPQQFWYYPNRPRLAIDEHGRPAIRFLIYKDLDLVDDELATVGFLFFDTVLSLPDEENTLNKIRGRLKQDLDLSDPPRLSPLQYRSGKVKLIFLDKISTPPGPADPPPEEEPVDEDWVTVLESAGMPSLYGENRAIFSVGLTRKAATLLMASFDGFIPAGVIYELDYVAMQRAFQVKVEVDWSVVYDYVRTFESQRFLFFSNDSEKIVAKLVEDKTIKIIASQEGIGDEGMQGQFDEVRKQLTTFVFEKFFEPKVNPQALLDGNIPNAIIGLLGGLRDVGLPIHFGCTKRELHDDELRSLDIDYTAYKAVERQIAPQGHLSMFWEDFAPAITREDVITVVDSEQSIWERTSLQVLASANFGTADVDRIVVDVAYGEMDGDQPAPSAKRRSVVLDATHPVASVDNWYDPDIGTSVHYRFTVAFGPDAVVGDGVLLTSDWRTSSEAIVSVNALELYTERELEFQRSDLLPEELFPEALVHVRYRDPDTDWSHSASGLLKAKGSSWKTSFRLPAGAPTDVDYRFEFPRRNQNPIETDWESTTETMVVVQDPRENLFPVRVRVAGDRSKLEEILVDLEYADPEADIHETGSFAIPMDAANQDHTWVFQRDDPARTRYRYNQVIIDADGEITAPGWVQSEASTLLVGKVYASKWSIVPEVVGPPLASSGLAKIVITIDYDDPEHDYHERSVQQFVSPGRGSALALELKDPTRHEYQYTVRYIAQNGFGTSVGPLTGTDTYLLVPSMPSVLA